MLGFRLVLTLTLRLRLGDCNFYIEKAKAKKFIGPKKKGVFDFFLLFTRLGVELPFRIDKPLNISSCFHSANLCLQTILPTLKAVT